jgi:hypothetical protein
MEHLGSAPGIRVMSCVIWPWCDGHSTRDAGMHKHHVGSAWREHAEGPELHVTLELHEADDGDPRIAIGYSEDGTVLDGCVALPLAGAEAYALSILSTVAQAKSSLDASRAG